MTSRQVQLHVTGVDLVTQDTLLFDGHACTEALVLKTSDFEKLCGVPHAARRIKAL